MSDKSSQAPSASCAETALNQATGAFAGNSAPAGQATANAQASAPRINHLFNLLLVIALFAVIQINSVFINQLLLSLLVAIILRPMVKVIQRYLHAPFALALTMVLIGFIFVMAGVGGVITKTVNEFISNIEFITQQSVNRVRRIGEVLQPIFVDLGIASSVSEWFKNFDVTEHIGILRNLLAQLTGFFTTTGVILLTAIFILMDADFLQQRVNRILHTNTQAVSSINRIFASVINYLEKKFYINLATGVAAYFLCVGFDVKFALMWSVMTVLFGFIPNIGVFIVSVPMIVQAILLNTPVSAGIFSVSLILMHFISGNVLEPRIMSRYLNLGNMVVWMSLLFWEFILGPVGLLLSVPLTVIVKILLEMSPNYRGLAALLEGDDAEKALDSTTARYYPSAATPKRRKHVVSCPCCHEDLSISERFGKTRATHVPKPAAPQAETNPQAEAQPQAEDAALGKLEQTHNQPAKPQTNL